MNTEVAASESQVIQKDDDLYPSDTIVEQAVNQHAVLKHPESMDKKEEDISEDASEEAYLSSEKTDESIRACLPETGIKLTAPSITSVDDTQNTQIPSAEKGDIESTLPKEQQAEIMQTSLQECSSINMGDKFANDSDVVEVEHEKNEINAEVSQMSSMLLEPDIEKTAEYVSDEMDEEKFSEKTPPPSIEEKSVEQPLYEERREAGDISAQLIAEDDSSMKRTEIHQVENKHIPLTADQEGKSPQALSYEKESDKERISPEDAQQISEEISESRNVSCADEEAEPTGEPQQSYQEILEPSQIICEGANDSKENANDNSTEREVKTSTEEMLVDSSSTIDECSKEIEPELYEATEKSSQVGLAAETGPANIQENDEQQTCQTEVEENETVSEMNKQNQIFPESDLREKNVIATESISYDNANMTNAALEGDNGERVELKAEETGYSFEEQSAETAIHEPYSSDQISNTDEISDPFSEKGDSAIFTDSDKVSSLNDNGNMESIDTEAKLDLMQNVENKREVVAETAFHGITEEINEESSMVSENQVDNLTNKATDEPGLIVDSRQNILLPAEDQISKLTDVREKEYESEGEKNSTEEENASMHSPDEVTEKDFESNNEHIQNDGKPAQSCGNEPDTVKNLETVNSEIEETKLDQGEQNQENSIHINAIGTDGDAQSTFTNIEPSPENSEVEDVELRTTRDVTSAEEKLEDSTNSAAAENNATSEASINKGNDQNENQSLGVTCVQAETEAEDTINKTDDSEKEIDLQYTEETQSTRDATVENFPNAITDKIEDDKNLENTEADPSQRHDETNTKNSNYNEESNEYKEEEPNESNEFHLEDDSNIEEAKNQVSEEESSSKKEGINKTIEVSQSQDECSKVYEDSIQVTEVEETTDKQHEEQEDRSPYSEHDSVLADQVKAMKAGIDSQNENELNASNSDGVHVQEDQTDRESCNYDEMDESDTRKNREIISQEFEQDKLVNTITSQESSQPIEPLEHNLGATMGDPTVSQPSEIIDDEAISFEASQAVGLEPEQHIQTNEDPEQENDISADAEFQEMNVNPMELSENIGTESDNIEGQDDDEEGVCGDTAKTVIVTDPKIEGEISTCIPAQSGKLDQEINADSPVKSQDEGTEESREVMQVVDIHEEVSADCLVSPKEVVNQVLHLDPGTDLRQENESNTASLDEPHPEKDKELINQESVQDSISSEMSCQETSATTEALRQDAGTAMDDHTLNESSEFANDEVHIVEVSKEADLEPEQHNQINEEPKHESEMSADESMDVENHKYIPESAELSEVNNTENEAINSRAADLNSKNAEDLSENTNLEISQTLTKLDEDPKLNTEVMPQDMSVENRELVPESAELAEEKNTENEALNSRAEERGSNTIEDSGNDNTDLEISQKEINTEVVLQDMAIENHKLIPESTNLREENTTENEAIKSRGEDLGSNSIEDLTGYENTNSEIPQKEINSAENSIVDTEIVPQDIEVENHKLIPESTDLREESNTDNEATNIRAEDDLSGNENTNSEMSQKLTNLNEDPRLNTEVMPQDMNVENRALVPEPAELTEENSTNTENEAIKSRAEDLGSNTVEDSGNENTKLEISQKEISVNENPIVNTDDVLQDTDIKSHELIAESTEEREENSSKNEAINKCRAVDLGSNTVEDLSGNENQHGEISQKVAKLDEDPGVNTEVMPQDFSVENREVILEPVELTEENITDNGAVNSKAEDLGSNTVGDGGNENTNLEISQSEISLNKNAVVNQAVVLQDIEVENHELIIPGSTELREENNENNEAINIRAEDDLSGNENTNLENEAVNSIAKALGSNTVEDLSGNQNTNSEILQNEINLEEDPKVDTEVVLQDMSIEDRALVPESAELTEDNNTENEAIISRAEDLGSNTVEDSGSENTDFEISETKISLNENPIVNTDILQDMDVESHELIPESTELREENSTENEAINSKAVDLGSNTVEDLSGNENTNSEMSQKVTNLDEDPRFDTEVVLQEVDVRDHEIIPASSELGEENNTENEAINSKADDPGSNTIEDSSGNENTNLEISQKEISLNEDPVVEPDGVLQDMDVENHKFVPESTELIVENNTENEAINSKAEESDPNTTRDLGGNENTNSEISQKEINLDENPIVKTKEKILAVEEPDNTERKSTEEGSQHTLVEERTIDEEKPIDTADASLLEIEEKTCVYDEQIQKVNETNELCMLNEMNESDSFKNKESESQGFEDDCTSKRIQNEQTPVHSEASGQNVGAEMPNQDNEECRKDASEVNNAEEVAEHDEHTDEALVDKVNEQKVIHEMDTSSSEVKNDETLLLAEQTTESPPGITQTNNAEEGPELGFHEQRIGRNEDDELDSNKTKLNMEMAVNLFEESQYIQEWEPNDSKQEEYVSDATESYIDGHSVDKMTQHETVQTQEKQPVEPENNFLEPSSPSEATSTTQNKEDCSVSLQDLNEEKEEDSAPEKTTQRELQVSSGFDYCGDLQYIPVLEEVSNTEEYLVPEIQGAHDPQNNEMEPRSCTNNYSHEINSEADQFQNNPQQTVKVSCADDPSIRPISENYGHISEEVTGNQEEIQSPEQLIETNNEEHCIEDIVDGRSHQAVKSEMTVEESKSEEDYGPHATSAYDSTGEKLVPAGSVEIVERSSEPGLYKESKKVEDEIMEEKEETNADTESHEPEFYEVDNDADRDEKTLSNTECNTKSDECSITISKDSQEISEEPNIIVTSTSLEGEAVGENFQQNKSGERTENEVRPMEPKMDASELLHQMTVPKPDNLDVNKEKQQESAKNLECCSTLEPQQENDRILFTEIQEPEDVTSREIDSGHSEVKLKLEEIPSEGKFTNASDVHMDCQEAEKVSAADIIASHIRQEIEAEDKLQQPSSEHQKQIPETSTLVTDVNDKTFNEEALHDESTENAFMSFDNPAEITCAPAEREIEHPSLEAEPSSDLEQKQDLKEKHGTMDNSVRTDPNELSSEFQGVESSAEVESDTVDSTLERLNVKGICRLNQNRETDESSELNFKSHPISGENLVNSCETSTESFEPVIELQHEKLAISEEIGNDAQLQTVKNEIMGESNPSNFEVYEAVATDASGEEEMHGVNTTIPSEDRALVQPPLPVPTTKSSAETEKPLIADEHSENTTFGVSQVSGINNTPPTEEKVSEQQLMKKVSDQDSNITQTMQIDEEQHLQGNYEDLHQSSHLQELCSKDSVNMRIDDPVDIVDVNYNGMKVEDFSKEESESNTNEATSLKAMQSVTTSTEEITAAKDDEMEEKPMLPSTINEKKGGEDFIVTHNLQHDNGKNAAEEPKTEKKKDDTRNDHGEEDSELIPMISETSRDVELKTQNKKSQHILSGMGSKMKNSISKVKKAMACASPQFSPDEVIIKLNKSKKS